MRDTKARTLAFTAMILACGSYAISHASADAPADSDIAAMQEQITALQSDVVELNGTLGEVVDETNRRADDSAVLNCLAYSDFHYYKERVGRGPKVRLPVMVWNTSLRECRSSGKTWSPKRRSLTRVVTSP